MIRVYTASKLRHAEMWQKLEQSPEWLPYVFFTARWIKHLAAGTTETPENAVRFWVEDLEDAGSADALMILGVEDDTLRGAFVEVGYALAKGVPVIVVNSEGPQAFDYGSWVYHPEVIRVSNLDEALEAIKQIRQDRIDWKVF